MQRSAAKVVVVFALTFCVGGLIVWGSFNRSSKTPLQLLPATTASAIQASTELEELVPRLSAEQVKVLNLRHRSPEAARMLAITCLHVEAVASSDTDVSEERAEWFLQEAERALVEIPQHGCQSAIDDDHEDLVEMAIGWLSLLYCANPQWNRIDQRTEKLCLRAAEVEPILLGPQAAHLFWMMHNYPRVRPMSEPAQRVVDSVFDAEQVLMFSVRRSHAKIQEMMLKRGTNIPDLPPPR